MDLNVCYSGLRFVDSKAWPELNLKKTTKTARISGNITTLWNLAYANVPRLDDTWKAWFERILVEKQEWVRHKIDLRHYQRYFGLPRYSIAAPGPSSRLLACPSTKRSRLAPSSRYYCTAGCVEVRFSDSDCLWANLKLTTILSIVCGMNSGHFCKIMKHVPSLPICSRHLKQFHFSSQLTSKQASLRTL
jgi:hypothetical protein